MVDKVVIDTKRSIGHGILQLTWWTTFDEVEDKVEEESVEKVKETEELDEVKEEWGTEEVKEAVEVEEEIGEVKELKSQRI